MGHTPNLKPGKNATSFSKDHQPKKQGRKKTKEISKLIVEFGRALAPEELKNDASIQSFLEATKLKGTINEVFVAKLYTLFLKYDNMKAAEMIINIINNSTNAGHRGGININFITPPPISQEDTIDLTNDSFTVQEPVKENED